MNWKLNEDEFTNLLLKNDQYLSKCKKIIICGPYCSGKSAIGKLLSKRLKIKFYDLDNLFNPLKKLNMRELEKETLNKFVALKKDNYILSLGGGTLLDQDNIKKIKDSDADYILFLKPSFNKILENLQLRDNLKDRKFLPQLPLSICDVSDLYNKYVLRCEATEAFRYFKKARIL